MQSLLGKELNKWNSPSSLSLIHIFSSLIGEGYKKDADELKKLLAYKDDQKVLEMCIRDRSLLLHTDASVTDIALDVGFNNTSYFIKKFQEANQLSPHKFRKKMS